MHKTLTSLFLLLLFVTSCHKEQDLNYNYYTITEPDDIDTEITTAVVFTPAVYQNIIETQLAIFQLLTTIMNEAIKTPALYYFTDNGSAEVRTGCPCTSVSGTTFPKTLTLLFDDGSGSCTNAGIPYSGSIDVIFNSPLGSSGAGPEIQVTGMTGLMINGYTFNMGGTIDMEFNNGLSFDYTIAGGPLSSVLGNISTSIPPSTTGSFTLGNDVNGDDDPNNPATYIDNAFDVSLDDALITCENLTTGDVSMFCTDTADDIELQPQSCSCPIDGTLRIKDNDGDCSTPVENDNSAVFDFGDGSCTGEVEEMIKVIEFISYEDSFTATSNDANGLTSVDVGVEENGSTPIGHSIQLTGSGSMSSDFTWTAPSAASPGLLNTGQTLVADPSSQLPWINEFHYDNAGGDVGEFVEIAGPAGLDLSCYQLIFYNGSNGTHYAAPTLSGTIPDEGNGFGAVIVTIGDSIQNGPDGFALIKNEKTHTLEFCD